MLLILGGFKCIERVGSFPVQRVGSAIPANHLEAHTCGTRLKLAGSLLNRFGCHFLIRRAEHRYSRFQAFNRPIRSLAGWQALAQPGTLSDRFPPSAPTRLF
jgi:hypothetical protein